MKSYYVPIRLIIINQSQSEGNKMFSIKLPHKVLNI